MARHNYKIRPAPHWEDGYFIPATPIPVAKNPNDWSLIEGLQSIQALARNAVEATTLYSMTDPCAYSEAFGTRMWVLGDPNIIRHIFVKNSAHMKMQPIRQLLLRPVLKDGLITAEGDKWRRTRHLLAPVFTPRNTDGFADAMATSTAKALPGLFGDETQVLLSDKMLNLAYTVLSDTLFSGEIEEDSASVLADIAQLLNLLGRPNPMDMLRFPAWIPRINRIRGLRAVKRVRAMISSGIKTRSAAKARGETLPDDFLTLLLNAGDADQAPLTPDEIEDQMLTFIGAGHETTSRAMTWMLYLLSQDTDRRARVEAEVDALNMNMPAQDWADNMPFAMACFEETMRLYPPAPIISREMTADVEYEGRTFKTGDAVMINLWSLHRHRNLWDRPDVFMPERFLPDARKTIDRFQYLPFGLGHRVCIGQRFALKEAAILIALIMRDYRFDYASDNAPWPKMRITVQAENFMPMKVSKR